VGKDDIKAVQEAVRRTYEKVLAQYPPTSMRESHRTGWARYRERILQLAEIDGATVVQVVFEVRSTGKITVELRHADGNSIFLSPREDFTVDLETGIVTLRAPATVLWEELIA
jgi:hypothetical protein